MVETVRDNLWMKLIKLEMRDKRLYLNKSVYTQSAVKSMVRRG